MNIMYMNHTGSFVYVSGKTIFITALHLNGWMDFED